MEKKKDIVKDSAGFMPRPNGQEWKTQRVQTPFGFIAILGNTRVLPLKASKKRWDKWFLAFVESRTAKESMNDESMATYQKWKGTLNT